jgi:type II secretory pathway component GspD/PulD (secretin)
MRRTTTATTFATAAFALCCAYAQEQAATAPADAQPPSAASEQPAAESAQPAEQTAAPGVATADAGAGISTRLFRLEHADAQEVASRFNATWSGDFGALGKVLQVAQTFPEANAVMVTAPLDVLDACAEAVREIDCEAPQVYIEARFIELSNNASHKLGIDWQMLDGMKGSLALEAGVNERKIKGVSSYNSADGTYVMGEGGSRSTADLSFVNGTLGMSELYVILRALESSEDARTFSNPKIIVTSGKKATVDMTTKYPNVRISAKRTTNSGGDSLDLDMQMAAIPGEDKMMFAREAFFSWGISLDVTPRIGTNGLINVQIVPTISSRSDWVMTGTSSDADSETISAKYPVIDVQRLVTEFNMASGSTAVIGGLSMTVETQKDSGIPWLRDWWWIGPRLFGSKVRVKEQREILVFVTVGIVDPKRIPADAGLPKNAVLGRQYTDGTRREPGDRRNLSPEGLKSLDMRPLEEQYSDPKWTNRVEKAKWSFPAPFTKDPNYKNRKDR